MKIIRGGTLCEIESFLLKLGGGNHSDNMQALREFRTFFLGELTEEEFLGLVFLQNDEVSAICPRGQDRRLGIVAGRAARLPSPTLNANWDIEKVVAPTLERLKAEGPRQLVLRAARDSELEHGLW